MLVQTIANCGVRWPISASHGFLEEAQSKVRI